MLILQISSRSAERQRNLCIARDEASAFHSAYESTAHWIEEQQAWLDEERKKPASNKQLVREQRERHNQFNAKVNAYESKYEDTVSMGRLNRDRAPFGGESDHSGDA